MLKHPNAQALDGTLRCGNLLIGSNDIAVVATGDNGAVGGKDVYLKYGRFVLRLFVIGCTGSKQDE